MLSGYIILKQMTTDFVLSGSSFIICSVLIRFVLIFCSLSIFTPCFITLFFFVVLWRFSGSHRTNLDLKAARNLESCNNHILYNLRKTNKYHLKTINGKVYGTVSRDKNMRYGNQDIHIGGPEFVLVWSWNRTILLLWYDLLEKHTCQYEE